MLTQIVFAIWLTPAEFGYWASATSMMAIVGGLVNLGEISGYLANPLHTYAQARDSILKANLSLMGAGLVVALIAARATNPHVAVLVVTLSLLLPLTGYSGLLTAAYLRHNMPKRIVFGQILASAGRILVGSASAWLLQSALAFVIASATYSLVLVGFLALHLGRNGSERGMSARQVARWERVRWALNSLAQYLPSQMDYLVLTFLSTPTTLGVYYMAYQITVGFSGLVAVPLSTATLANLSKLKDLDQHTVFLSLARLTLGGTVIATAALAGVFLSVEGLAPVPWEQVPSIVAILLASLPARFVVVLSNTRLMAAGRWTTGTILSSADAIGTCIAALTILVSDIEYLAMAIVLWKLLFAALRFRIVAANRASGLMFYFLVLFGSTIATMSAESATGFIRYACLCTSGVLGLWMLLYRRWIERRMRSA